MSLVAIALITLAVSVVAQALFAGYETGFVSLNPLRIRYLAEANADTRAARLLRYMANPDQMLAMLLIGTNIGTIAGTIAVARAFGDLGAMLITTPVMLLLSEIIPKSVFRAHPNRLSLAFMPVIDVFYVVLAPLAWPVSRLTQTMFRAAGKQDQHLSPLMASREDMKVLVDESADHGTIRPEERRMIHSVINLQATSAHEIMVPRIDMEALPTTATRDELIALFERSGRTRVPIFQDTIDTVVGVVNAYDLLLDRDTANQDINRFVREVLHVPDTMKVDDLFELMKREKQHMAILTDEYGGTDGLVTIEDILEEIFGDIQDEHDREERQIHQVGPNAYVIDARTYLEDVTEAIGVTVTDEEVETVGGWTMRLAGRIPAQGEVITAGPFRVTILDATRSSISKIRLEVLPETTEPGESNVQN